MGSKLTFPETRPWFELKAMVGQQGQLLPRLNFCEQQYLYLISCMQAPRKALGGGGSSGAASRAIASAACGNGVAGTDGF